MMNSKDGWVKLTGDKISSAQVMKNMNQQMVLNTIYQNDFISRVEIANKVGLTQQTITNIVSRLIKDGVVIESKELNGVSNAGRRPIPLRINSSKLYALGIEISRKRIRGVLMDFSHNILVQNEKTFKEFKSSEQAFKEVLQVIDLLISKCPNRKQIKGIGVSVSGIIDRNNGVVLRAEPFHWLDFKLKVKLELKYLFPVYIENDVNMIAVVENATGSLIKSQNNITGLFDQGVGGAIVMQKQLYAGSKNVAGEFGAIKAFYGKNGLPYEGGSFGSLTAIASISGLEAEMGVSFNEIIERIQLGEQETLAHFQWIGEVIGNSLSNLITFFDPDHVLLTGKLIEETGELLVPIIEKRIKQTMSTESSAVIIKNIFPKDIAKVASMLVLKETFDSPVLTYN